MPKIHLLSMNLETDSTRLFLLSLKRVLMLVYIGKMKILNLM